MRFFPCVGRGKKTFLKQCANQKKKKDKKISSSPSAALSYLSSEIGISAAGGGGGTAWCSEIRWRASVRSAASSALSRTR